MGILAQKRQTKGVERPTLPLGKPLRCNKQKDLSYAAHPKFKTRSESHRAQNVSSLSVCHELTPVRAAHFWQHSTAWHPQPSSCPLRDAEPHAPRLQPASALNARQLEESARLAVLHHRAALLLASSSSEDFAKVLDAISSRGAPSTSKGCFLCWPS